MAGKGDKQKLSRLNQKLNQVASILMEAVQEEIGSDLWDVIFFEGRVSGTCRISKLRIKPINSEELKGIRTPIQANVRAGRRMEDTEQVTCR